MCLFNALDLYYKPVKALIDTNTCDLLSGAVHVKKSRIVHLFIMVN